MAHTNDKVCLTITAFLTRGGKVLLVNHPKYSMWLPIGGHIDPGEDTDEALFREIKEEAGFERGNVHMLNNRPESHDDYRSFLYTPAFVDRHKVPDRDHVAFVYFGEVLGNAQPVKSDEHSDMRWFSETELGSDMFKPDVAWYAKQALRAAEAIKK